jgi:hypothetical protein
VQLFVMAAQAVEEFVRDDVRNRFGLADNVVNVRRRQVAGKGQKGRFVQRSVIAQPVAQRANPAIPFDEENTAKNGRYPI